MYHIVLQFNKKGGITDTVFTIHIRQYDLSYLLYLVHPIPSWLVWAEIKCAVHFALTKRPMINRFQPVQQSWQQAVRTYCTKIYTVGRTKLLNFLRTDLEKLRSKSTIGSNSLCSGIFGHVHVHCRRIFLFCLKLLPFTSLFIHPV